MALILQIDTALEKGIIALSDKGKLLSTSYCESQRDQSSWLVPAIRSLVKEAGFVMNDLAAIAVVAGPGSYTGLRVGMATAKGLCYALAIPLLTESGLELLAKAALIQLSENCKKNDLPILVCAMIDARRMEVFMGMYDEKMEAVMEPGAIILDASFFAEKVDRNHIVFCGNAVAKWEKLFQHINVTYLNEGYAPDVFAASSFKKYLQHDFTLLAYAEPVYLKEVYIHPQN
jgi:tRNA threonylcarbamoyladenosine biosynthesis protein TsaB